MPQDLKFDIAYHRKQKKFVLTLYYTDPKTQQPSALQFPMSISQVSELVDQLKKLIDESHKEP